MSGPLDEIFGIRKAAEGELAAAAIMVGQLAVAAAKRETTQPGRSSACSRSSSASAW